MNEDIYNQLTAIYAELDKTKDESTVLSLRKKAEKIFEKHCADRIERVRQITG